MGPDVSEITGTPMQRTCLEVGTSGDGLGEVAEAQRWAGAGDSLMRKKGIGRADHFIKKLLGLTPHSVGNVAHRVMLPSQQEKEMQAAGQDKATQRSNDLGRLLLVLFKHLFLSRRPEGLSPQLIGGCRVSDDVEFRCSKPFQILVCQSSRAHVHLYFTLDSGVK